MASADIGNYQNRRLEAMINIPVVDDRLDIRVAGEWTKRQGYSFNSFDGDRIDGRDLWSGRVTIGWKPISSLQTYLVWEHFSENDDRLRSSKQLCKTDYGPGGTPTNGLVNIDGVIRQTGPTLFDLGNYFIQGCLPASLYSPESFGAPLGYALPYALAAQTGVSPYPNVAQSPNLHVINSSLNPIYRVKNDTVEYNADYTLTPTLTLTSQTGYNQDFLWSTEDYNRFGSVPGFFGSDSSGPIVFCDPQLGCSDRLITEDLSDEHTWQLSQEFRLTSNFDGPFNFSAGGNYLHYETLENYYVFFNAISAFVGDNPPIHGHQYNDPKQRRDG